MTELSKSISKLICLITVKTGEDGKMFGTVTSGMIADQLKTQFEISLDKKKIHLEQPLRALGDHEVELRLHADVTTTLKVRLESSTPLPAPVAAPAPDARKEDARTEKRGRHPEAPAGKAAKPETGDKKTRPPRPDRTDKPARPERAAKPDKAPKSEKPE
jgi:large subunit ribosomal protein L9